MCKECNQIEKHSLSAKLVGMQLMGVFFGYPLCCIKAFIERARRIHESKSTEGFTKALEIDPVQEGFNHGFLPCVSCASKIKPGEEGSLIKESRACSTPYPIDKYSEEEFDEFVKGALLSLE